MSDKPSTTDPEQRRRDTERSRHQSGLPPESETRPKRVPKRPRKPAARRQEHKDGGRGT